LGIGSTEGEKKQKESCGTGEGEAQGRAAAEAPGHGVPIGWKLQDWSPGIAPHQRVVGEGLTREIGGRRGCFAGSEGEERPHRGGRRARAGRRTGQRAGSHGVQHRSGDAGAAAGVRSAPQAGRGSDGRGCARVE
jgi:hypothetical protein